MTNSEVLMNLRLVLDELMQDYIDAAEYNNAINHAQNLIIHKAYNTGDFRCLRPLCKQVSGLKYGDTIPGNDFFYPVAAVLEKSTSPINFTNSSKLRVTYAEPNVFWGYDGVGIVNIPTDVPATGSANAALYTTLKDNETDEARVYFNVNFTDKTKVLLKLLYVKKPIVVDIYAATSPTNKLSLPKEYHPMIVSTAAELLQGIDVNEMERGDLIFQNTRQNLERFGTL